MEEMLFKQMQFVRKRTIAALDATTEHLADEMPGNVKNSIRWNLGHIFVSQDTLLYPFIGEEHHVPKDYLELFAIGSSPHQWKSDPPTLQEIRNFLVEQPIRIQKDFAGKLEERIHQPFKLGEYELTTLGELLSFAIWHEGLHQGAINTIKRAVGTEDLWTKVQEENQLV
ncbi:DinB family protein [Sutcliffiella horikoshii]|uniref:DinB family protein n=1 Tax=Sutcliffiella horikoshii TaxID=79883 RepID=A0A5D4SUW5_9BACI|nr:DinB family protein [Sutcliffiella horikoshii]TYS65834.1 DinB family protein [Sutcliffiella horikoshii]